MHALSLSRVSAHFKPFRPLARGVAFRSACALVPRCCRVPWPQPLRQSSPSLPIGLSLQGPQPTTLTRGLRVVFPVPPLLAMCVLERGWLSAGVPTRTPAAALSSAQASRRAGHVPLNRIAVGEQDTMDRDGQPFSRLQRTFLPCSTSHPPSTDGRDVGPVSLLTTRGEATPLWTF